MNARLKSLTYVGAGNIGSHTIVLLARSGLVKHLTLVDPDRYETRNLGSQDIGARDVGRFKVDVLAARVHSINPELRVDTIRTPVEQVPPGRLRADVIASSPDGLGPRRHVNRIAFRLGVPLVDAGVRAEGLLVRVDIVQPSLEGGCLECGWSTQEIASLDVHHPCTPVAATAPTATPAYTGALAASIQTRECLKLLRGDAEHGPSPHQIYMDSTTYRCYVTARRRSPECRFKHGQWAIRPLGRTAGAITLGQALRLVPPSGDEATRLRVPGQTFVHRLMCPECHASRQVLCLASRIPDASRHCPHCRTPMVAPGMDVTDSLDPDQRHGLPLRLSLHALGLRGGDLFSIETRSGEAHFEIGGR